MTLRDPRVWKISLAGLVLAAVGFAIIDFVVNYVRMIHLPKNVGVVRAGVLYRSGQLDPKHFDQTLSQFRIRTVIQLNPESANAWEADAAARFGADLVRIQMPGTGLGRPEEFAEVLAIVRDPSRQPVLVHCAAGANRTGMTAALYRMLEEGWAHSDALREMQSRGFDGKADLPNHLKRVHGFIESHDIR
jgi:protein tyrosine phosphatase (PTP) superfamily phosphohydrolase (DUF442 family)